MRTKLPWLLVVVVLFTGVAFSAAAVWLGKMESSALAERESRPTVTGSRPADGESAFNPLDGLAADVRLPTAGAGVDPETLEAAVTLVDLETGEPVKVLRNTTGSGDAIIVQPINPLEQGRRYKFEITDALKDRSGAAFTPYAAEFTTATGIKLETIDVAFEKVDLDTELERDAFTCLALGPDGRLYAGTFAGVLHRWDIAENGTLVNGEQFMSVLAANGGPRMIMGFAFSPDGRTLWVSHGQMVPPNETGTIAGADDFTGKISTLDVADLSNYTDVIVGLPRGFKDHLNFQPAFGPDGRLYFNQGSHTSTGSPDNKWGLREERLLTAAVLALDPEALPATLPLDVTTEAGGGDYDPFAEDAALRIHATGIRSGYDMLWHSNGKLYSGINGAAAGGKSPGGDGVPAIDNVKLTTDDLLLAIEAGGYYGHPNPVRGEFVLNGGNPTAGVDPQEIQQYPVGTQPLGNWREPAFVFGKNLSPNGLVEWTSGVFGDELGGAILVTRYSAGDDVAVLIPGPDGRITETLQGVNGLTQFTDPLDLVLDEQRGHLYIAEYGGRRITLVRPTDGKSEKVYRRVVE
ncbi:MAG: Ig-like domain-containing protein [Planctomycetota bacterium]